ncbi:MAG TPA: hypothetical protein VGE13_00935 [Candidatus Saccharimonadales bacterium]
MKSKLLMFATALLSLSVIGLAQLDSEAKTPGQVGTAPRCTVEAIGKRGNTSVDLTTQKRPNLAFSVTNSVAKVSFKVSGSKDCKVRLTINSFHAPALDGKPWNKQILYNRSVQTKVFTKGTYTMETAVPTQPKNGMCYYQVDLTYGTGNVLPIIAYGHGKIQGCIKTPPKEEKKPAIKIQKLVEGVEYKQVNVDVEYSYQIAVTNTGNQDLTNAVVTDTPEAGVTLVSAEHGTITDNKWTYTIPSLKVGETMNFTLKAKVPEQQAGRITNTVCVDTPDVPGTPDDCDEADVDVPEEEKVVVCNPKTGETITVDKKDQDKYAPIGSSKCKEETPTPETPEAKALPTTGPEEALAQLFGAVSLTSAGAYYLTSRRQ